MECHVRVLNVAHLLFVPKTRLARMKELAIFEWREHLVQMLLDDFSQTASVTPEGETKGSSPYLKETKPGTRRAQNISAPTRWGPTSYK